MTASNNKPGAKSSEKGAGTTANVGSKSIDAATLNRNLAPPSSNKSGSLSAPGGSKVKYVMEPEPRKMQAERPLLLQDLSQSKLLLKFKQENKVEPVVGSVEDTAAVAAVTSNNQTSEPNSMVLSLQPTASVPVSTCKSTSGPSPEIKTSTDSPLPSKAPSNSSRKSSFQAKMVLMSKTM